MPWELGRCAFEANGRHIDVRNVVWLGTSNVGHGLVFEHHEARAQPDEIMSKEEYVELMGLLRPRVSERLGVRFPPSICSLLSDVDDSPRLLFFHVSQPYYLSYLSPWRRSEPYALRRCTTLLKRLSGPCRRLLWIRWSMGL